MLPCGFLVVSQSDPHILTLRNQDGSTQHFKIHKPMFGIIMAASTYCIQSMVWTHSMIHQLANGSVQWMQVSLTKDWSPSCLATGTNFSITQNCSLKMTECKHYNRSRLTIQLLIFSNICFSFAVIPYRFCRS